MQSKIHSLDDPIFLLSYLKNQKELSNEKFALTNFNEDQYAFEILTTLLELAVYQEPPIATHKDGEGGEDEQMTINRPLISCHYFVVYIVYYIRFHLVGQLVDL